MGSAVGAPKTSPLKVWNKSSIGDSPRKEWPLGSSNSKLTKPVLSSMTKWCSPSSRHTYEKSLVALALVAMAPLTRTVPLVETVKLAPPPPEESKRSTLYRNSSAAQSGVG